MAIRVVIDSSYRFSTQDEAFGGAQYFGVLLNRPALESQAKKALTTNAMREITVAIDNHENLMDLSSIDPQGMTLELSSTNSATWYGKITSWQISETKVLSVSAREKSIGIMNELWPDEEVRLADFNDASREAVEKTIPIALGGSTTDPIRVPFVLVDRVNFRYLGPVGEIRSFEAVYKDSVAITTGFTEYKGAAGQATYPGMAYIEFASDPRDTNGRWPEIFADVVGLVLNAGSSPLLTEDECRNPAWILYYLLTTARTGACGWGMGVPAAEIDSASFAQSVSDCASLGYFIDGAVFTTRSFREVVAQIEASCRGRLIRDNGANGDKYYFTIDKDSASAKTFTTENSKILSLGNSTDRKNRHVSYYRFDPIGGRYLASATREDVAHQTAFGDTVEEKINLELVKDQTQAGALTDYFSNSEKYGGKRIVLEVDDFASVVTGSVITINRTDFSSDLNAALFRVERIRPDGFKATIEARSYSASIFGTTTPGAPVADPDTDPTSPGASFTPPGAPSGLTLSTGNTQLSDGTTVAFVEGTFSAGALAMYYEIEYGIITSPQTYKSGGTFSDVAFRITGLENGKNYIFRVTPKNVGGAGTAITGTITTSTDVTAPGKPQTPVLTVYFKSIAVKCLQNATKAPDMAGFKVFRHTSNASASATEIGFVACSGTEESVVFLDESTAYGTTYYYWLKPVDRTGNVGVFSDVAIGSTLQIVAGDITTGTITATQIAAATITADRLNVACLSAISANMGTVTAGTICAVTVCGATIHASTICSSTLCSATIYSGTGNIGGWCLASTYICGSGTCANLILYSNYCNLPMIEGSWGGCGSGRRYLSVGNMRWGACYRGAWGFSVDGVSDRSIALGHAYQTVTLQDGTTVAIDQPFAWIGDCASYLKYYNGAVTVCGSLYATSGNIGGWCLGASCLSSAQVSGSCTFCTYLGTGLAPYLSIYASVCSYYSMTGITYTQVYPYGVQTWACRTGGSCTYSNFSSYLDGVNMANAPHQERITASAYCAIYCANNQLYSYGWGSVSDANQKDIWIPEYAVLPKLRTLPVYQWTYRGGHRSSRLGPLAQDFAAQFPEFSPEPEALPPLDGFLMKAVQELDCCNETLRECVSFLENRLANIESKLSSCA